jgi:hypothetical protein
MARLLLSPVMNFGSFKTFSWPAALKYLSLKEVNLLSYFRLSCRKTISACRTYSVLSWNVSIDDINPWFY